MRGPRLEMHVAYLQAPLGAVGLGVEAADQVTVVEDRQRVVAVHALRPRGVDLDAVVEAEQARDPIAVPEQRVEWGQERGAVRGGGQARGAAQRGEVAGEGEPAPARALHRDLGHEALGDHPAQGDPARGGGAAGVGQVVSQVDLERGPHRVERPLDVPAEERVRGHRLDGPRAGQRALQQVEPLLEVPARVNGEHAGHPEVVQRVLHRPPVPPAAATPGGPLALELGVPHGAAGADQLGHGAEQAAVLAEPARPAGVAHAVVEHRAPPPRQHRDRHEARGVGPVLHEEPAAIDETVEARAIERPEAAPDREVVRAVDHVDGVHLDAARVLREAEEAAGRERVAAGPPEVLPVEEEGADRVARKEARASAPAAHFTEAAKIRR